MGEISYTVNDDVDDRGTITVTWANMGRGDYGTPYQPKRYAHSDRSVHVYGTFDSATVYIVGSNEASSPSYFYSVHDVSADDLTFTDPGGIKQVLDCCAWIRPTVNGTGGAASITVILYMIVR